MINAEKLFSICNASVLPGWALLVFAPRWRWTQRICAITIPALLGCVYTALFISQFGNVLGGFGSLAAVSSLFKNPEILLAGWIHYLAFDLAIGSWEVRDARRLGIPHFGVIPCLALTFMLGPIGFLLYVVVRFALKRRWEP
jgi:hypothetical protein